MNRTMRRLLLIPLLSTTILAHGAERLVYGTVITVEPLANPETLRTPCVPTAKPPASEGLGKLLAWDLLDRPASERDCQAAQTMNTAGYRVTYEWNGHRFEDVLPSRPGKRIPLTLQID